MSTENNVESSPSSSETTPKESESFVLLFDDEPADTETQPLEQPLEPDESDGSFVLLFDDQPVEETKTTDTVDKDDGSFVVLFDDEDQSVQDLDLIHIDDKNHCSITLPPDMRIRYITAIKTELEKSLDASEVTYDISHVNQLDTASIQLLRAHINTLQDQNTTVSWTGDSVPFTSSAQTLGFSFID